MKESMYEHGWIELTSAVRQEIGVDAGTIDMRKLEYHRESGLCYITVYVQPYTGIQSIEVNLTLTPDGADFDGFTA